MKFSIFVNPQVPGSGYGSYENARKLRPIARDVDAYQEMLDEVRQIAVLADQTGYDAMMLTEHHFHSEGYELSVNPLMFLTDLAARTERILLAPLGMVLPAWDPIRAAEDVALLDNFSKGRLRLGVARGYQSRWSSTLAQRWHTGVATGDRSAMDDRNFEVFGEILKIMKMAWTQESIRYRSEILDGWSIPSPYDGIEWPAKEWTREFGAEGELTADGTVHALSVAPRPYQDPYPELWQPFAISDRSIVRCAQEDILPWMFTPDPEEHKQKAELFQSESAKAGRNYALGEHTGILKLVAMGSDRDDAMEKFQPYVTGDFAAFNGPFGYLEVLRRPSDDPDKPVQPTSDLLERWADVQLALVGSPDDVKRGIDSMLKLMPDLEWFGVFLQGQQGVAPLDVVKKNLEMFATEVIPEFQG